MHKMIFPLVHILFNVQKIHQIIALFLFKINAGWDIMKFGKQLFCHLRIGGLFIPLPALQICRTGADEREFPGEERGYYGKTRSF